MRDREGELEVRLQEAEHFIEAARSQIADLEAQVAEQERVIEALTAQMPADEYDEPLEPLGADDPDPVGGLRRHLATTGRSY